MVLVCVLKSKRDLDILKREHWYRIPVSHAPVSRFDYLAFYVPRRSFQAKAGQPKTSRAYDKCIPFYTRVKGMRKIRRDKLLPDEKKHPQAKEKYLKIRTGNIMRLKPPIKNIAPRRISFGFTTLKLLKNSKDVLEVYEVLPIEQIVAEKLKEAGIKAVPQKIVNLGRPSLPKRRFFRLDFAIYCRGGKIAIECDNQKAHSLPAQKVKDKIKDRMLKKDGWTVIRIREPEVLKDSKAPIKRVKKAVQKLSKK